MWDHLFKKQDESTIKSTKIYIKIFFLFYFTLSLNLVWWFYLLFYVNNVKIKNKILLLERILSFILTLCNILCPLSSAPHELWQHLKCYKPWTSFACFALCKSLRTECKYKNKYNSIKHKCNSHCEIIETTQFVFCSSYTLKYFVLPRTMEMLNKSTSTIFFFLISLPASRTSNQHSLPSAHWWVSKDGKEKGLWVAQCFPLFFYVKAYSINAWIDNGKGKEYDRVS